MEGEGSGEAQASVNFLLPPLISIFPKILVQDAPNQLPPAAKMLHPPLLQSKPFPPHPRLGRGGVKVGEVETGGGERLYRCIAPSLPHAVTKGCCFTWL